MQLLDRFPGYDPPQPAPSRVKAVSTRESQSAPETRPEPASTRKPDELPRLSARRIFKL